ncbi:MAG: glycosyl hydrolase [Bacteroidales bacterium]
MSIKRFLIVLIGALVIHSCDEKVKMDTHFTSFSQLRKNFTVVPDAYKTVPFWVWNGEVTEKMIDEQLADFSHKGFGGVFIHPRYGLITEYASEEWYSLVAYALKRAKKLDINVWIYDENSFPSGFAGGIVPAEMPSSYNEGHALRLHRQSIFQPDSSKEYHLIYVLKDSLIEIKGSNKDYIGTSGEFLLYEKVYYPVTDWYAGYSYVDLLKPGVTEKFIEVTMTGYEETIGNEFGHSVPGVFTDEPNIAPQGGNKLIRWTPDLFEQFTKRWGYRLEPHLVSLVENNSMSKQVRHNYYQLLLELFIERWSKPWYEYTEEKGLAWTGHYWEHGWPSPHHGPDNMAMYAWHQIPGIDMLFNTWEGRPDQFGNIRAVRELNSVANQLGRVRSLSETYGASGWELTFEDMKRNGDWEYVLGVNLMNQHLSYQTLLGDRKHDFPQSFSYHAPYWEQYPALNQYFNRLSVALASGEQLNNILVLEPTTSAWMSYAVGQSSEELNALDNDFRELLELMEDEQIEYDLGSENIIRDHGSVLGEMFVVGERAYDFVVIPTHMTNLNSETAALLEIYMENGGIVVALCHPPAYIDGIKSSQSQELAQKYSDQWISIAGCNDPRLLDYLRTDEFLITEQSGGSLLHMRRQLEDGQLLFLVNSSKTEICKVQMVAQGKDLAHMDLISGAIEMYPCLYSNDILSFNAEIDPCGSLLLFISDHDIKKKQQRIRRWNGKETSLDLSDFQVELKSENALTLDYCSIIMDSDTSLLTYFYNAQTAIFNHHGFPKNPWVSASQFRTSIIDRDTFPEGSGFIAQFPFFADSRFESKDLRLVVERPGLYEVSLNGMPLEQIRGEWWLDKAFGVYRIREGLVPGDNVVEIKAEPMSVYCELEPVYLVGDFDVLPLDRGWLLATASNRSTGSWKESGMPFYSGRMDYSASFTLGEKGHVKVRLPSWEGTVVSVTVNGKESGQLYSKPYELRIDDYVNRGENHVTVSVYGSLKNLLGPHHNIRLPGLVTPWSFKYAPEVQPSGIGYDLEDYGLMEPFEIVALTD